MAGIRKAPELTADNWKELSPVGLWASLAHAFSVLALGAGAVSFGQIVKAAEPVFAAGTNAVLLGVRGCVPTVCFNHRISPRFLVASSSSLGLGVGWAGH